MFMDPLPPLLLCICLLLKAPYISAIASKIYLMSSFSPDYLCYVFAWLLSISSVAEELDVFHFIINISALYNIVETSIWHIDHLSSMLLILFYIFFIWLLQECKAYKIAIS